MSHLYAALAFIAFLFLLVVLAKDTDVTVSEKLNALQASVANVTALVQAQTAQIADLKSQIQAAQADKAQAESDAAALQAEIDKLNAIAPPAAQ